ncbi:MAG: recombinase family protein [Cyanobacteria bacterium P01_G01_bin.39]
MKIIAYIYSDPLLESPPDKNIWGWEIDRVYQDWGEYQQLEQLITDCQSEQPDYLLIRRLEELGENLSIIGDRLNQLESLGIKIIATEQDYSSPQWEKFNPQELKLNLSNLLQQIQHNKKRIHLEQGHARNRLKITPPPGKAPYGYRRGQGRYIIDKSTAPVVKDFFERFLLFGSLRGAVRYLEKRYGKKISPATGRNWLRNPVYRGSLKYKNSEVISHTHAPIIDAEEAAQIDRLLRRNRRLPSRTASAPRSLAGLVSCQQCQLKLNITRVTQHQKQTEYLYLRCPKCPQSPKCKAIAYQEVLDQTIAKICVELPVAVAQLELPNQTAITTTIQQEIAQKQTIIEQLPALLAQQVLDQQTVDLRNYKLRTEIAQLEAKIAQLPPGNLQAIAQAVSLPQFWLDLSEAERRFYFREFIKQIEIIRNSYQSWLLKLIFIF